MKIKDAKPQVGIFEIVENYLLTDTEDVQAVSESGDIFDGTTPHLHMNDVKRLVIAHPSISEETKQKFLNNKNEYLKYPRGRVDYNTKTDVYTIMASPGLLNPRTVEILTRAFHLPPEASGRIELIEDTGHYYILGGK